MYTYELPILQPAAYAKFETELNWNEYHLLETYIETALTEPESTHDIVTRVLQRLANETGILGDAIAPGPAKANGLTKPPATGIITVYISGKLEQLFLIATDIKTKYIDGKAGITEHLKQIAVKWAHEQKLSVCDWSYFFNNVSNEYLISIAPMKLVKTMHANAAIKTTVRFNGPSSLIKTHAILLNLSNDAQKKYITVRLPDSLIEKADIEQHFRTIYKTYIGTDAPSSYPLEQIINTIPSKILNKYNTTLQSTDIKTILTL